MRKQTLIVSVRAKNTIIRILAHEMKPGGLLSQFSHHSSPMRNVGPATILEIKQLIEDYPPPVDWPIINE